jgi:hypothetical protein
MMAKKNIFDKIVYFHSNQEFQEDFLTTGDKIHYFFEKDIFDAQNNLKVPKEHALNKIGHVIKLKFIILKNNLNLLKLILGNARFRSIF